MPVPSTIVPLMAEADYRRTVGAVVIGRNEGTRLERCLDSVARDVATIVYVAVALTVAVWYFMFRSYSGLILRSVGDNDVSANALGYPVLRVRMFAVIFGGACAGIGGAYLSLVYTPQWTQAMTAGRGWIAIALVVFGTWLPGRIAIGALLFGAVSILQLHAQAIGLGIPSQFLSSLPYVITVIALVIISRNKALLKVHTPACLGRTFVPDS